MEKYIALLRGINVGKARKILMVDLREALAKEGYEDIQTYIQSGNVVFSSTKDDVPLIEHSISTLIKNSFSHDVPVMVRTAQEFQELVDRNPFIQDSEIEQLHVAFLQSPPQPERVAGLETLQSHGDSLHIHSKDIFIRCKGAYRDSKIANPSIERKLKQEATTRNWKTVLKLSAML